MDFAYTQFATKDHETVDKTAVLQQWHQQIEEHRGEITAVYAPANKFKQIIGLAPVDPPRTSKVAYNCKV